MARSYETVHLNQAVTDYIERIANNEIQNVGQPLRELVAAEGIVPTEQLEQVVGAPRHALEEMGLSTIPLGPFTIFPEVRAGVERSKNHR